MSEAEKEAKPARRQIDWEAIGIQYRAGIRSLKNIGEEFGVSDAAIIKRAKKDKWTRDLKAKIQAKADALVSAAVVSEEVSARTKIAEETVVDANAKAAANVILSQRKDFARGRRLTNALFDELEAQTDPQTLVNLRELGAFMRSDDKNAQDRRNDTYNASISLVERAKTLKVLTESMQKWTDMERLNFGVDDRKTNNATPGEISITF